jgi:hypothetical protein
VISPGLDLVHLERKVTEGTDEILLRSSSFLNTIEQFTIKTSLDAIAGGQVYVDDL